MIIHYLFNILILYMVNNISISITDNSNKGKKGKKKETKQTKQTNQTKKPRKTRKDKGVPRKKKTTPVNVAPTQTGTYAYNTASNPPIHLEPPFIEQNKIEISNLKNKINEITPQHEIMNTKLNTSLEIANETSRQLGEFNNKLSGIVKKEVVNNLNTIYKPPSVERQERRSNLTEKKFWSSSSNDDKLPIKKSYKNWQNEGYNQWQEIVKRSKERSKEESSSTDEPPPLLPPPPELKRSSSAVKQAIEHIETKLKPPPLSSTMTPSLNRLTKTEPIDNPPSLVDVEQFKNDILGNETEEKPRQRRKPRFEFKRVYTHRYESS
jgi:hypothetical protein